MKCIKCKADCIGGSTRVQGDTSYDFCKTCSAVLDSCPRNMILEFLTPEQQQSQVTRNIWLAKRRRALGQKKLEDFEYYNKLAQLT